MILTKKSVALNQVCVDYLNNRALDQVSWSLPPGTQAAILGPNGSGKSTLLRTITGYGHITSGQAIVLGEKIGETEVHQLRRKLGVVDPSLVRLLDKDITAAQLVATGFFGHLTTFFDRPSNEQLDAARELLSNLGLENLDRQLFFHLSSGQRSRVWLARALINNPQLMILDEPTADLDLRARETLLATLDRLAKERPSLTIVMVTHHLQDLLPNTQEVLLLGRGKVVAVGSPEAVLTSHHLSQAFECPVKVRQFENRWMWSVPPEYWSGLLS